MRKVSLSLMGALYIFAGIYHFANPSFYLKIMPNYIPFHLFMIYFTGVIEIVLGLFLFIKRTQKMAGWLIILMLFAFLPVHFQMLAEASSKIDLKFLIVVIRLPLQFVLMYWAYKTCNLKLRIS
ncbi:MAG: hypothetical protein H0U95_00155 [Bacteroidetes bacterium]|nr:hypothetical protein [Bacteroidota bacterium]